MSELIYIIDKEISIKESVLAIIIRLGNKAAPLDAKTLRKLADKDAQLIDQLIQHELNYQKKIQGRLIIESSLHFNTIHIPYNHSYDILKALAPTGRVFFNEKKLVIDPFGKSNLFIKATTNNSKISFQGFIKTEKEEIPLNNLDYVSCGPPHWYIKGFCLQFIAEDISNKIFKQLYENPESLSIEDLEDCQIIYEGNSKEVLQQSGLPQPFLILKDPKGAFADLGFIYEQSSRVLFHLQNQKYQKRDKKVENDFEKDLLETDFKRKPMDTSQYYCPVDKIAKSILFLLEIGWKVFDIRGNEVLKQGASQLSINAKGNDIVINGKVDYGTFKADVKDVVGAFNRRQNFIQLYPGAVGLLPQQLDQVGLNGVDECEIVTDGLKIRKNSIGAIKDLLENPANQIDPGLLKLKDKLADFKSIVRVTPEITFKGTLREYQLEGLSWLAFLHEYGLHGILADDMGLGKTVQVLAFISRLPLESPILIVLPTSLLFNWQREIEKFLPEFPVYRHHGTARLNELPAQGIILTSYSTLRLDLNLFSKVSFQCVILDEAQAIKNASTQTSQSVCALNANFRLSITGTPIENHLNEIWSQFRFLIPDLFGEENAFLADIQASSSDPRYLQKIKKKIRPFILRRTKDQVAKDLPEKIEQTVYIEMDQSQRKIYDDFLAGVKGNLIKKIDLDGVSKHRIEIFEAILRLRQICCHPLLVSSVLENDETMLSSKLSSLIEDLETVVEEDRKALVYSQFTSMLAIIAKELKLRGWNHVYLDGSTIDREKVVMQFQNDPKTSIFLISLKAGGIGLNLTAADYVFLYDPWWNEAAENQAINRAHRIGRKDTVIAKRYIAVETIEEKMMKLKAAKRNIIDSLLDDDMSSSTLSDDDFRFLLS